MRLETTIETAARQRSMASALQAQRGDQVRIRDPHVEMRRVYQTFSGDLAERVEVYASYGESLSLERRLQLLLDEQPLEPGEPHPAEAVLFGILKRFPLRGQDWIQAWVLRRSDIAADVLVCLSRLDGTRRYPWVYDLARKALAQESVGLRHAAVRALERWGGPEGVRTLVQHQEDEAWLEDYIRRVIRDLDAQPTIPGQRQSA